MDAARTHFEASETGKAPGMTAAAVDGDSSIFPQHYYYSDASAAYYKFVVNFDAAITKLIS